MATDLSRFEFNKLDIDGRTTKIEQWIEKGPDISYGYGDEIREKYEYLVQSEVVEDRLTTFQFYWLDRDGRTRSVERRLGQGNNILGG